MSVAVGLSLSPPVVQGMKVIERSAFSLRIPLWALKVPAKNCAAFIKDLAGHLLTLPRVKFVIGSHDPSEVNLKLLLLNCRSDQVKKEELAPIVTEMVTNQKAVLDEHTIALDYDYWTADQILRSVLPPEVTVPTGFEIVGHIAHLNLREEHLESKGIIGQVLLDKNPQIKTVVNKLESIDSKFRFFKMEVLAGEDNTLAEVRESGCVFRFDFSQVYWNSRLHTEHERLVSLFKKGEIVLDMFAGVGPFAIPASKKGCIVHGNDLNPASYQYLVENSKANKVEKFLQCYNLDGRDFVEQATKTLVEGANGDFSKPLFHHVVMNLPATAIEFLDVFSGLFRRAGLPESLKAELLPMIHCHCFSPNLEQPEAEIKQRVEAVMKGPVGVPQAVHRVRSVSTTKDMFCFSFRLPHHIAFASPESEESSKQVKERSESPEGSSDQRKKARVD